MRGCVRFKCTAYRLYNNDVVVCLGGGDGDGDVGFVMNQTSLAALTPDARPA